MKTKELMPVAKAGPSTLLPMAYSRAMPTDKKKSRVTFMIIPLAFAGDKYGHHQSASGFLFYSLTMLIFLDPNIRNVCETSMYSKHRIVLR